MKASSLAATLFGDATVISWPFTRLSDARVQAEIGDQLLRTGEALDITDRGRNSGGDCHIHSRQGHEPPDQRVFQSVLRDIGFDNLQRLFDLIDLADITCRITPSSKPSTDASGPSA